MSETGTSCHQVCSPQLTLCLCSVTIVPDRDSMVFLEDKCTLDASCYWHATIRELRQEGNKASQPRCFCSTQILLSHRYGVRSNGFGGLEIYRMSRCSLPRECHNAWSILNVLTFGSKCCAANRKEGDRGRQRKCNCRF